MSISKEKKLSQLLSRVIFDKGALLFTTGGNNATFQPNPNSVYQTEHLSYFKFVGRVVPFYKSFLLINVIYIGSIRVSMRIYVVVVGC